MADRVTFRGEVSDAELAALYRSCEVFVMPSGTQPANGSPVGEGFGRVYVEAALAGKPVVGSCLGGVAEAVSHGKTGFLVGPGSVDEAARAVTTLLSDAELAASMGGGGAQLGAGEFHAGSSRQGDWHNCWNRVSGLKRALPGPAPLSCGRGVTRAWPAW